MARDLIEVLKEINNDVTLLHTTYKKQGDGGILGTVFGYAFIPEAKFLLPPGEPPYKVNPAPVGMCPTNLVIECKRFYTLCRPDLRPLKREQIFVQMLEGLCKEEAEILLAIKDQNLTKLYPNITRKVLADANYAPPLPVTVDEVKEEQEVVKKVGRPRGRPRKSESPQPTTSI